MIAAAVVAAVAFALSWMLEMADGALLTAHVERDQSGADPRRAEREYQHRALSMARVVAYLSVGASVAEAARLQELAPAARVAAQLCVAVAVISVTSSAGRAIALARPDAVLATLGPVVRWARRLLSPAVRLGTVLERWLNIALPAAPPDAEDRETTEEQFREVVAAEADISSAEEALIHGVFSMGETEVREIMVPRVDIVGVERSAPWSEVVDRVRSSEHARLPVYENTLDNITGVLYAKDMLADVIAAEDRDGEWQRLVRRAAIIPTSKHIDAQLREFQSSRTHIAIVVDEYGGTAGLVTIEDILEEIVGEIHDEYDDAEPEIRQEGMTRFWVAGRVSIDELSERLDTDFGVEEVTTVGGLVYELFNRVPHAGESVTRSGYRIVVESVRRRGIERVYFERVAPPPLRAIE